MNERADGSDQSTLNYPPNRDSIRARGQGLAVLLAANEIRTTLGLTEAQGRQTRLIINRWFGEPTPQIRVPQFSGPGQAGEFDPLTEQRLTRAEGILEVGTNFAIDPTSFANRLVKALNEVGLGLVRIDRESAYAKESDSGSKELDPGIFTHREKQILELVAQGLSYKEIGEKLGLSPNTINNHLARVREKGDFRNRVEAAVWVERMGFKVFEEDTSRPSITDFDL